MMWIPYSLHRFSKLAVDGYLEKLLILNPKVQPVETHENFDKRELLRHPKNGIKPSKLRAGGFKVLMIRSYKISDFQGLLGVLGVVMIWKQRYCLNQEAPGFASFCLSEV